MQAYGISNLHQLDDSILWMRCGSSKHGGGARNGEENRAYRRNTNAKNAYRQTIKGAGRQKAKAAVQREILD